MKVGLRREDAFFGRKGIIGVRLFIIWFMSIQSPLLVGDTSRFETLLSMYFILVLLCCSYQLRLHTLPHETFILFSCADDLFCENSWYPMFL